MKRLRQVLSLIHRHNPSILPVTLMASLVQGLFPFLSLVFSAGILDLLLEKSFHQAVILAGAMLITIFLAGVLQDFLQMQVNHYTNELYYLSFSLMYDRALELDYASISSHDAQEARRLAQEAIRQRSGLGYILSLMGQVTAHTITILTAFGLVLQLCLKPSGNHAFGVLALGPVSLGLTLAALSILMLSNFHARKKDQEVRTQHMEKSFRSDIIFQYLMGSIYGDPQSFKTIQMNHMGPMLYDRLCKDQANAAAVFTEVFPQNKKMARLDSLFSSLVMLLAYGMTVIKILSGAISVGGLLKYTGAITQFSTGFLRLIGSWEEFSVYLASMAYVLDFYEMKNKYETGSIPVEKRLDHVYELEFHDVSFAYPGTEELILKNVSCRLNLKQKMAVVGPNGAGKSTFIKLLCRLYEPTSGCITLNGVDIRKYDYQEYLSLFSVVFQDFTLFPYSVAENIASGKEPDESRVREVLQMVEMEEHIRRLPEGVNTPVFTHGDEEGVNFSGGELQKLAIARALYRDAPVVILDEPTAALDPKGEYEIYSHFDTLVKDKTSIFISHRMSSCRFCEDIMVFEDGRIRERGSHEDLLERPNGLYAQMWRAQAQYYEMEEQAE